MSESVRLIKKYPNRRLYDTKTSAYITLSDVKELVVSVEAFRVVDAKTGDDLTRSILLQVILEEEATVIEPLLGANFLTQLIRCYGHSTQGVLGKYLEMSIKSFSKLQEHSQSLQLDECAQVQTELWTQFVNSLGPDMQTLLAAGMNQDRKRVNPFPEYSIAESRKTSRADK